MVENIGMDGIQLGDDWDFSGDEEELAVAE